MVGISSEFRRGSFRYCGLRCTKITAPICTFGGKMKFAMFTAGLTGAALLGVAPLASAVDAAAGARLGTLGYGIEGTIGVNERLNLRVPFSVLPYDKDFEEDDIEYNGKLDFSTIGVLADFHPFKGSFFISGGLMSNGNTVKIKASDNTGNEEYELGETTYTSDPNDPLKLRGKLDFDSLAPYAGFGWGNPIQGSSNWYFRFELGALFQGSPKIGLDASGSAQEQGSGTSFEVNGNSPEAQQFQADLEDERQSLESDISEFDIYPVINFSLGYRFSF